MVGTASVARAFSGYLDSLFGHRISNSTLAVMGNYTDYNESFLGDYPDFLAFALVIGVGIILALGVKSNIYMNNAFTFVNIGVVIFVICLGFSYSDTSNWTNVPGGKSEEDCI